MILEVVGLLVLGGYLVGSIPFGLILSRLAGLGDIRSIGSGSIGATNVLRTGRKDVALATLVLDAAKGAVVVLYVNGFGDEGFPLIAGAAAVLGHCTSIWLRGRGGQGRRDRTWRDPGLGVAGGPRLLRDLAGHRLARPPVQPCFPGRVRPCSRPDVRLRAPWDGGVHPVRQPAVIIARHHANIRRLLAGTEPRIGAGR